MIPYQHIQDTEDRSWSLKLVQEIADGRVEDEDQIADALGRLDDPRVLVPLTKLLEDKTRPDAIRSAASLALAACSTLDTVEERAKWWSSGDSVLMRHAVCLAERSEAQLLTEIISDPHHPFHIDALRRLDIGYEEREYQVLKIQALSHSEEEVRALAADILMWDEPVTAIPELIRAAANDTITVAKKALNTLAYYGSKQVLLTLNELRKTGRECLRTDYEYAFADVRHRFQNEQKWLLPSARAHFAHWLGRAAELLNLPEVIPTASPDPKILQTESDLQGPQSSLAMIIEDLNDADGLWKEKKERYQFSHAPVQWQNFDAQTWGKLRDFLLNHRDPAVREFGCWAAQTRHDGELLLAFLEDPIFSIRKSAAYGLRYAPLSELVAERLWKLLQEPGTTSTHAYETLESWIIHAKESQIDDGLLEIALNDERESPCAHAVWNLGKRKSKPHIGKLVSLLTRAPIATWTVHTAVLDTCREAGIHVPCLHLLLDVDDLELQSAVCTAIETS